MTVSTRTAFTQMTSLRLSHKRPVSYCTRAQVQMQIRAQMRKRVAQTLAVDLPKQYKAPFELHWGIYDTAITFDDPMTQLRGKLMYKVRTSTSKAYDKSLTKQGMILTIAVIARLLFVSSAFELSECGLLPDGSRVRTVFRTTGRTRWGTDVVISGVDYFWFGENESIVRHESTWDQTPAEVVKAFWGR